MQLTGNTARSGTTPGAPLRLVDMSSHLGRKRSGAFFLRTWGPAPAEPQRCITCKKNIYKMSIAIYKGLNCSLDAVRITNRHIHLPETLSDIEWLWSHFGVAPNTAEAPSSIGPISELRRSWVDRSISGSVSGRCICRLAMIMASPEHSIAS